MLRKFTELSGEMSHVATAYDPGKVFSCPLSTPRHPASVPGALQLLQSGWDMRSPNPAGPDPTSPLLGTPFMTYNDQKQQTMGSSRIGSQRENKISCTGTFHRSVHFAALDYLLLIH